MSKDDPFGQRYAKRTLWLDKVNMTEARHNFFMAWMQADQPITSPGQVAALKAQWDVSWAAAIAAFDYMQNGRVEPY